MAEKILVVASKGNVTERTPVWFMRQAGRYLPEYMKVKKQVEAEGGDFFTMCYTPKIASEITLQPTRRFDIDAAIIFSDILVILESSGWPVKFIKDHGPSLEILSSESQLSRLKFNEQKLDLVMEAIKLTASGLNPQMSLIGFAGSPFTVALYALSGGKVGNNLSLKALFPESKAFWQLCNMLVEYTYLYLKKQIEAGAEVIKLFESHASLATFDEEIFEKYVIDLNQQIIARIKADYPEIPVIFFPRGSGLYYSRLKGKMSCDVIALDESVPLSFAAQELQQKQKWTVQGNLDNSVLCYGSKQQIQHATTSIMSKLRNAPFIFNLGHGVIKETSPENVALVLETIREFEGTN